MIKYLLIKGEGNVEINVGECDHLLIIGNVDPLSVLVLMTRVASPLLRLPSSTCEKYNLFSF